MGAVHITSGMFEILDPTALETLSWTLQLSEGLNDFLLFKPVRCFLPSHLEEPERMHTLFQLCCQKTDFLTQVLYVHMDYTQV